MKKGKKIAIIAVSAILISIVIFVGVVAGISAMAIMDDPVRDYSDWMSYLREDVLLKKVVIPGSHDAGSKGMNWMCETQNLDIAEQLTCGVRYFDIRIEKKDEEEYVVFHGIGSGMPATDVFEDIVEFISVHTGETLLLDFQHFKGDSQEWVISSIEEYLGEYILRNDGEENDLEFIDTLTVGEAKGKCIIFWGSEDGYVDRDYVFLRNDDLGERENATLQSYYVTEYNTKFSQDYVEEVLPIYLDMYREDGVGLFVLQGQLTDGIGIRGPRYLEATHDDRMNEYVIQLAESENLDIINIIMRDYINYKKTKEIIHLNLIKNNVVLEKVVEFESSLVG